MGDAEALPDANYAIALTANDRRNFGCEELDHSRDIGERPSADIGLGKNPRSVVVLARDLDRPPGAAALGWLIDLMRAQEPTFAANEIQATYYVPFASFVRVMLL